MLAWSYHGAGTQILEIGSSTIWILKPDRYDHTNVLWAPWSVSIWITLTLHQPPPQSLSGPLPHRQSSANFAARTSACQLDPDEEFWTLICPQQLVASGFWIACLVMEIEQGQIAVFSDSGLFPVGIWLELSHFWLLDDMMDMMVLPAPGHQE